MTPRPYSPDPNRWVRFGKCSLPDDEGIAPARGVYLSNPPIPKDGMTLFTRKRGREYYKKLKATDLLSQQEAAAFLKVHRMQINRWVRAGQLIDRKILGTSRIEVGTLLRFAKAKGIALVRGVYLTG